MTDVKLEDLCPGIRGAVKFLWERGWTTTDSGDGSRYQGGFIDGCREPMVALSVGNNCRQHTADGLLGEFRDNLGIEPHVELTYSPNDKSTTLIVAGECLRDLETK